MADLSKEKLDPNVKESGGDFTVVPPAKYKAVVVGDELKPTKDNKGKLLELKWQIIEGEYKGEQITDRLNIINKSAQAQAIGQGQLKKICNLCSVPYPPSDTTGLFGKPMTITVKIEKFISNTTGSELESNKISGYGPPKEEITLAPQQQTVSEW